jgi:phospholipid-binding lipoprotein MlaA
MMSAVAENAGVQFTLWLAALLAVLLLVNVPARAAEGSTERPVDPWEGYNREMYAFNDFFDRNLLKPVATGYDDYMPGGVKRGVANFFDNLGTPAVAINQLLQGKPVRSASSVGRFVINTTFGIAGFFDPASRTGLTKHREDFGQTLVTWGIPNGPFFVIPFRGPATVTHAGGMVVDWILNPVRLINPDAARYGTVAVDVVQARADLLGTEALISGDRYLFIRDAYLQNREFEINDGRMEEDPFLDAYDEWEE